MDPQTWMKLQELFARKVTLQTTMQQQTSAVDEALGEDNSSDLQTLLDKTKTDLEAAFREEFELQTRLFAPAPGSGPVVEAKDEAPAKTPSLSDGDDSQADEEASTSTKYSFKLTRPDKFKEDGNFADFCEDFKEHVELAKIKDENLHIYFLNLLDATTKKKLRKATLTKQQQRDPEKFIPIYRRKMMPVHEAENLQMEFSDLSQEKDESIEAFAHRVEDTASLAFAEDSESTVNGQCFSAFVKGLYDTELRILLRESSIRKFPGAVEEAIRRHGIRKAEEKRRNSSKVTQDEPQEVYRIDGERRNEERRPRHTSNNFQHQGEDSYQRPGRISDRRWDKKVKFSEHKPTAAQDERAPKGKGKLCYKCNGPNHLARHCLQDSLNY